MAAIVVTGATCMCSFGTSPCVLQATSQSKCLGESKPIATIQDVSPGTNLAGFGMCTSLTNPAVASATAAALGVLTPQPCTMVPMGVWSTTKGSVLVGGKPCLTSQAVLSCSLGQGTVKITNPGQTKIIV